MLVAASMHDREVTVFVEALEADHRRMEAVSAGDLDRFALFDPELRPRAIVRGVSEWHDGVESVVTAGELDDHEDAIRVSLDARPFERLRRECRLRAAQDERQPGADPKAVHAANQEVPTRAFTGCMSIHKAPSTPKETENTEKTD